MLAPRIKPVTLELNQPGTYLKTLYQAIFSKRDKF